MLVLVTGATGFVGSAVVNKLDLHTDFIPRASVRRGYHTLPHTISTVQVIDLAPDADWSNALQGVDVVVHLAGRAHMLKETASDSLDEFRRINVAGTMNLARQAVTARVKRFVFISSIGVNGNMNDFPFTEKSIENPVEPYAVSKMEAEHGLRQLVSDSGMEVVIIRPPLVYGPNAPGNFGRLNRIVERGIPLPLGAINNKRSLVALDNLVDFIVTCIDHPAAADQTFLVSDGEDLSTTELLKRMAIALGRPILLVPVPVKILEIGAALIGKRDAVKRISVSLQVDISKARDIVDWVPPINVDEGLRMIRGIKNNRMM